jgi:hypothetical protein
MGRYSDSSDDAVGEYYQAQSWRKQGAEEERERIIALLENQHNFDQIFLDAVDEIIALIKGETNA